MKASIVVKGSGERWTRRRLLARVVALGVLFGSCLGTWTAAPLASAADAGDDGFEWRDGDIVFQRTAGGQARAIELATGSPFTHVGVVLFHNGRPHVYEAVQPVRRLPVEQWIRNGVGEAYVVKRLRSREGGLDARAARALRRVAGQFLGRDYDLLFTWNDEALYCSELVWKAYQRALDVELAPLRRLGDYDLTHPEVRRTLQSRYGDNVPLSQVVIAPADIFHAEVLMTVREVE